MSSLMRRGHLIIVFVAAAIILAGCGDGGQNRGFALQQVGPQLTRTAILLEPQKLSLEEDAVVDDVLPPTPAPTLTPETMWPRTQPAATATAEPRPPRLMVLGVLPSISLRTSPSTAARAVVNLAGSEVLWAEGRSPDGRWLWVVHTISLSDGSETEMRAWVAIRDVQLLGDLDTLPIADASASAPSQQGQASASSTASEERSATAVGRVLADRLNVRGGPGVDQPVIGQLASGEQVALVGRSEDQEWLAIAWPAGDPTARAWVAARYIEATADISPLSILAEATTRVPEPTAGLAGKIAFQTASGGDIYVVNADGGGLRRVANGLDPVFSPDGRLLAYAQWGLPGGVMVLDLGTGEERRVTAARNPRSPSWSPDGARLAFAHLVRSYTCRNTPLGCFTDDELRSRIGGDCMDTPQGRFCISDFALITVEETSLAQVTLADGAWLDIPSGTTTQSVGWNPRRDEIIFRGKQGLQIAVPDGAPRPLLDDRWVSGPAWSPDGQRIAVQIYIHDHTDLFLLDTGGNIQQRLTEPPPFERSPNNVAPTWSPDGRFILFLSDRDGDWRLYRMNADGSDQKRFLPETLSDITFRYDFAAERMASWGR